jgi:hypothetical protein
MSILTTGSTFHDPLEELLQEARQRIDNLVTAIAQHHYITGTQEHHLTPRIAQAIQDDLRHHPIEVDGLKLEVLSQDIPDRGGGAMESKIGADLYISLTRFDVDDPISKGVLIQAKRRNSLLRADERRRLRNQIARMRRRSKTGAYVWVFDDEGVTCVEAPNSSDPSLTWIFNPMTVGELIVEGLRCNRGDRAIGRPLDVPPEVGITRLLHRLSTRGGLDLTVKHGR